MENEREPLVVLLAGYEDRMHSFSASNPDMGSRIAQHIDFPDYTQDELVEIGDLMLEREGYALSPAAREAFVQYLGLRMTQPRFANVRSVRNALERARLRQANRLVNTSPGRLLTKSDLVTIEADDITQSRVFQGEG